ncbi:bifunctional DNase/RNase [Lentimicrobium saccharophilum]|uniref:Bifunctional DNase/RNase n=1 Tax=Lentimicrobium saccharophilum TaxID=1678841 RepID=A0A0S7C737_9BACT|nr:bifunctional nuclease family protein [Lentimicrobium saccharophilum]GAP44783.1 bifunctional DNase/RNase [Lentimicrobium saccharophilum]
MEKIALKLLGMINSQSQSGAYTLILGETEGKRRLPILINGFEAQAILFHIEQIKIPRPLTHDLFKNFADTFGISFREVIISKFAQGIFYGTLVCEDASGIKEIDSRTSDAIALAVRFNCPIFTYEAVLEAAGVSIEEEPDIDDLATGGIGSQPEGYDYDKFTVEELEEMMNEAIEKEDYERASQLRDIINRRKPGK